MSEEIFKSILKQAVMSEYADLDSTPEHKFSLKHRLAMKRIFARYERNVRKPREKAVEHTAPGETNEHSRSHLSIKQRLAIALIIILLLALMGCGVAMFISKDFHGRIYKDNTHLFPVNLENAPLSIEYTYALNYVPDEFELIDTQSSPMMNYTLYGNASTRQTIVFSQYVKSHYNPHINTEHHTFEEININGTTGLFVNLSRNNIGTLLIWDNGDYIIELLANLDKEGTMDLAKIHKI